MPVGTPGTLAYYLSLVTSEYADQPNFIATLTNLITPFTQVIELAQGMNQYFNITTATGDQLTKLGQWLNISRGVQEPIDNVYFSLDSATLGLDQGSMFGPGDSLTGLVSLPDDIYREIIKAYIYIYNNSPTKENYYIALEPLFTPAQLIIQGDNANNLFYGLTSTPTNALITYLFTQGYFNFAPAGVGTYGYNISSTTTAVPFFGLDVENSAIAGLDIGWMIGKNGEQAVAGPGSIIGGVFTLTPNATSTTVTDTNMLFTSRFKWWPVSADAALMIPYMWVLAPGAPGRVSGSIVVNHPSNSAVDLNFEYELTI
jgi:Protein of unknown function (DUF2612)